MSVLATQLYQGTRRVATLDPADRGLAYGDGLFETARVHDGLVVWWPAHLARLSEGAARLRIPMPAVAWLNSQLAEFTSQAPARAVLKLILTRGAGGHHPEAAVHLAEMERPLGILYRAFGGDREVSRGEVA